MQLADMAGADPVSVYRSLSAAPDEASMLVEQAVRIATGRGPIPGPGGSADAVCLPPRLVLVVDQFEELFTAGEDGDAGQVERVAFIAALDAAATVPVGLQKFPAALVVAAVRADFLGRLIAYPPLKAALEAGPFMVGPMSEAELRLAITGPAAEAGLAVEPALDEAVIAELREGTEGGLGRGVLPLMSQAMAASWQRREGSKLTLRGYRRAGGVADAVNRSAQAAYDTLTRRQKDAARLVFTQLTIITPDGQLARRRCSRTDLRAPGSPVAADIDAVIDLFSAQRLLVLGQNSVEISHDALLQAWKRLRALAGRRSARPGPVQPGHHRRGHVGQQRPRLLLPVPARAAHRHRRCTTRWQRAPARYPPLPATTTAFLGAAHHAARRSIRRRRGGVAILALLTVLAVAASGFAFSQRAAAVKQRDQAIYNQVVAEALQLGSTDTTLAAQLNLAAYRIQQTQDLASRLVNTENTPLPAPLAAGAGFVYSVAFSRDGHVMASGNSDGTTRLWNVADPAHPRPLGQPLPSPPVTSSAGGTAVVQSVTFSPDGGTLASGDNIGNIQLWDVADPARPHLLGQAVIAGGSPIQSVAFSPDGRTLAVGDDSGDTWLWDVADPAHPRPLGQPFTSGGAQVNSVAFSPDGHTLATGDNSDGTVRLWDVADPAHPRPFGPILPGGASVAFSPHGHVLASGDYDTTVRLWDVADPAQPHPLGLTVIGSGATAYSLAFSPDGNTLASGDYGGTVQLWDVTDPAYLRQLGQPLTGGGAQVNSVAFSPDGHTLTSGSYDGTVRLWDVANPADPRPLGQLLSGSTVAVDSVAFSPDGHTLASGSEDGTTRLWNLNVQYAINRICAAVGGLTPQQWSRYIPRLPYQRTCVH